jgi:hypothetical protein
MPTVDFAKTHKDLYTAGKTIQEVRADSATFLAVDGQGAPGGEGFQKAIEGLYSVAYTIKFTRKQQGTLDFKVNKLECVYLSEPEKTPMDQWQWRMLVRVPDEVTAKDVTEARKAIRQRKGTELPPTKRIRWKEGRCLQVMHVGPYDQVGATYRRLDEHAAEHGLTIKGPAHEIYISDPRRTAPERLKTIVRMAVAK